MAIFILLSILACVMAFAQAGIEVGYSNVLQDTVAGDTTVEYGSVPRWLAGSYIRHSCGAFGETHTNISIVNKVDHLFDCIEMGQSYRFEDGRVTFYNRFYDTANVDLWRAYNMNMNDSRVFWIPVYSRFDYEQQQRLQPIIDNSGKIPTLPHVAFWQMGNKVFAHSEYPGVVQINPHEVTNNIAFHQFDDDNFGYTHEIVLDEQAHETEDDDGTLYCSHMVYSINPQTLMVQQWKNVFKIKNNVRSTLVKLPYPDLDLRLCGNSSYPILMHRQGYLHTFAMTENYIVIPESSYLIDICSVIAVTNLEKVTDILTRELRFAIFITNSELPTDQPYFPQFFHWEGDIPTRFWVIRKSDGKIMTSINTTAVFVSHQLNAYEEGNLIHADMIIFHDSSPYTYYTYVTRLMSPEPQENEIRRYTINSVDWSLSSRKLIPGLVSTDFPAINQNYFGRPYTFAYMIFGIYTAAPQILTKLNVTTGELVQYSLPEGFYGMEPAFVQSPDTIGEDQGVVLMQGLDTIQNRGFVMIFDARDMSLLAHLTGSDLVLFGIHAKFIPAHFGNDPELPPALGSPLPALSRASTMTESFVALILTLFLFISRSN